MKLEETAALVSTNTLNPDPVDDDTLWQDLPDEDQSEVDAVLDCNTIERVACFAHSLQLVVKDGLAALTSSTVLSVFSSGNTCES